MKRIKCKCGSEKMLVDTRFECDGCEHGSCTHLDKLDNSCNLHDGAKCTHPDNLETCSAHESRAHEDGECDMGPAYGEGCWLTTCAECGGIVDHLPLVDA